jgi:hypothetical protein
MIAASALATVGLVDCAAPTRTASGGGLVLPALGSFSRAVITPLDEVLKAAEGTYISRVLADRDSTLDRWRDRVRDPIRVWIAKPTDGGGAAEFPIYVRGAFEEWQRTEGLPVRFAFVANERDAEVAVRWTSQMLNKTGNTVWRVDRGGWMERADIVLATHLTDGRALDASSLHAIALHEVGHLLGLSHSQSSRDVMAPLVRVAALSTSDRATAKLLYSLPAGRVR